MSSNGAAGTTVTVSPTTGENVFQFKIVLDGSHPPIWRSFQVPDSYNFRQLHKAIQCVMGWRSADVDYHLHQFVFPDDTNIGIKVNFPGRKTLDEKNERIKVHFGKSANTVVNYNYDFGDEWDHKLTLDKILPAQPGEKYPSCVDGAGACPPEDCGGISGYYELLKIIKKPKHSLYTERRDWAQSQGYDVDADPHTFDPKSVEFTGVDKDDSDFDEDDD